jgi:citrate lyase subunit beta/citryl-CoA lyase
MMTDDNNLNTTRRYWRSLLHVPVTSRRMVDSAHVRGADAVLLDLEDGVAIAEKDEARRQLPTAIERVSRGHADILVRINRSWEWALRDLEVAIHPDVCGLELPKVGNAEHVRVIAEMVQQRAEKIGMIEAPCLVVTVETPQGILDLSAIAHSSDMVCGLQLGTEDLATEVEVEPDSELLTGAHAMIVMVARASGLLPLGLVGSILRYEDEIQFRALVRRSRRFGYVGATGIHPRQIPILNEEFTPSAEELERACGVVETFDRATARGAGAVIHDGSMIDEPVARRAHAILRMSDTIKAEAERRNSRVRSGG